MKLNLISFDPDCFNNRSREGDPTVRIAHGKFSISKSATSLMGLSHGNCVQLHQNQDEPGKWYLSLEDSGFPLRKNGSKSEGSCIYNSALVKTILDAFEAEALTFLVYEKPIRHKGTDYWLLLTIDQAATVADAEEEVGEESLETEDKPKRRGRKKKEECALPTLADLENPII